MRHPPYHLRLNKAVDRFTFIEAIGLLATLGSLSEYTYYSLGGPYLEDCRLLYEFYPEIKMVSIEKDEETYKRQIFHQPCGIVNITRGEFNSFLAQYEAGDSKSIFWLDYTGLEFANFEEFMELLGKVAANSMIKLTLSADPRKFKSQEKFREKFEKVLPAGTSSWPSLSSECAQLVQQMVQIASQTALPSEMPQVFQPVSSFYYSDGMTMLSLVGIVCERAERDTVRNAYRNLQFANLEWEPPKDIDLPILSTKERLHIQHLLPCAVNAGAVLRESLGYLIDRDILTTEQKLEQYAAFHRLFPYFVKASP